MIDHLRNQTAYILTTTQDKFGDQKEASRKAIKVRFRYMTDIDRNVNREAITADAIIWFSKDEAVTEGTIVQVDDKYWRVNTLIKARKMDETVQFLKAFVEKHTL